MQEKFHEQQMQRLKELENKLIANHETKTQTLINQLTQQKKRIAHLETELLLCRKEAQAVSREADDKAGMNPASGAVQCRRVRWQQDSPLRPSYSCQQCGKRCWTASGRDAHVRTKHKKARQNKTNVKMNDQQTRARPGGQRKFSCPICSESFGNWNSKQYHLRTTHKPVKNRADRTETDWRSQFTGSHAVVREAEQLIGQV